MLKIRKVNDKDLREAQQLLDIYSEYVLNSSATFELEPPSVEEMQSRVREVIKTHPWIVIEQGDLILGYAYASVFRTRQAYAWSTESTVYVRKDHHGRGLGVLLYTNLFKLLKAQGFYAVIGGITIPNDSSVALHERMGFQQVAQLKDIGYKMQRWWDVGYWQLQLREKQGDQEPKPISTQPDYGLLSLEV